MSLLRVVAVAALLAGACGGAQNTDSDDEPTTAKEKQRRDMTKDEKRESDSGKWGGWKYQGDRDDCFFLLGRRCFKTQIAACNAAKCKAPQACTVTGGGPASITCDKPQ